MTNIKLIEHLETLIEYISHTYTQSKPELADDAIGKYNETLLHFLQACAPSLSKRTVVFVYFQQEINFPIGIL